MTFRGLDQVRSSICTRSRGYCVGKLLAMRVVKRLQRCHPWPMAHAAKPPARPNLSPHTVHQLIGVSIADLLRASSDLRIEGLLDARAWTTAELAEHTGTSPHWLESILRGLAAIGLIRRVEVEHVGSLWSTNRVG
jgi:hypothetical protein